MTPRRRAILIVVLAALLIGIILAAVFLLRRAVAPSRGPGAGNADLTPEQQAAVAVIQNPLAPVEPAAAGRTAASQMAELYAERYGSYSNQGDYQNLRDLLPVMTAKLRAETEVFLAKALSQPAQAFEGVTSVKISTDVRAFSETAGTAVIAVTLQQEKVSGTSATVGYRTLRMELKKDGQEWRVDAARWENELTPVG